MDWERLKQLLFTPEEILMLKQEAALTAKIGETRKAKGLKRKELAKELGISKKKVKEIELCDCTINEMAQLLALLDMELTIEPLDSEPNYKL